MKQPQRPFVFPSKPDTSSKSKVESVYVNPVPTKNLVDKNEAEYYKRIANSKDHSSLWDNAKRLLVKSLLPVGNNAASFVNKKLTGVNSMDRNSLPREALAMLYKVAERAKQRNGNKNTGGIEYEDYRAVMTDKEFEELMQTVKGNVNPVIGAINGKSSQAYDLATTLGRFSYASDNKGNTIVTDTYDFTNNYTQDKDGKLKKDYMKNDNSLYGKIRRKEAERDQNVELDPKKLASLKSVIPLTPIDTVGYVQKKNDIISTPIVNNAISLIPKGIKLLQERNSKK